ncbi:hypothetical protein LTR78_006604 [Recurvomyces mirabilis]|uniref:AB hydrolase-1 domain-containing protein n=1 Tax=Recurvomyces mirabilis TaxID=574656 RepID=A0AAE1BZF5_9PEZI|nr:hypothetical protein LTR78_006604 [Recurvomyces mirabilis]KAK5151504.1 hypothetical protein LTS14_009348 [Recurvomyces mirabilis]
MGHSGYPKIEYRFVDHVRYLDAFLDSVLPTGEMFLVVQDWGSALGLHWAHRYSERVIGIVLMEFIRPFPTWEDVGPSKEAQGIFKAFRTPETGRKLLIEDNVFLTQILPGGIIRKLGAEEQEYYRHPFLSQSSREPVYRWPNELPISHHPPDVWDIVSNYRSWLMKTDIPKLLFYTTPGAFVTPEKARWYEMNMENVRLVDLGDGVHYLQEDHPRRIGEETADFMRALLL